MKYLPADLLLLLILTLFLAVQHQVALAEPVLIRSATGEAGQGWMFGAPRDGQCWVVLPAHVVRSKESNRLEPFHFTDTNGASGETGFPISGVSMSHASTADVESHDLAFAKVVAGRDAGGCQSRLGAPSYKYLTIMRAAHDFNIHHLMSTSFRTIPARIAAGAVDNMGGAIIDFNVEKEYNTLIAKGISGSTVTAFYEGSTLPIAMVLRVKNDSKTLRCMRFDYIKERFLSIDNTNQSIDSPTVQNINIPYRIIHMVSTPAEGDTGVNGLLSGNGCWRAKASQGMRTVDITLAVETSQRIERLQIVRSATCGGRPLKYWVDQQLPNQTSWEYLTSGLHPGIGQSSCRISLAGPRLLRIRFDAEYPLEIQSLRLE